MSRWRIFGDALVPQTEIKIGSNKGYPSITVLWRDGWRQCVAATIASGDGGYEVSSQMRITHLMTILTRSTTKCSPLISS